METRAKISHRQTAGRVSAGVQTRGNVTWPVQQLSPEVGTIPLLDYKHRFTNFKDASDEPGQRINAKPRNVTPMKHLHYSSIQKMACWIRTIFRSTILFLFLNLISVCDQDQNVPHAAERQIIPVGSKKPDGERLSNTHSVRRTHSS